jgi:hypothetical protein
LAMIWQCSGNVFVMSWRYVLQCVSMMGLQKQREETHVNQKNAVAELNEVVP